MPRPRPPMPPCPLLDLLPGGQVGHCAPTALSLAPLLTCPLPCFSSSSVLSFIAPELELAAARLRPSFGSSPHGSTGTRSTAASFSPFPRKESGWDRLDQRRRPLFLPRRPRQSSCFRRRPSAPPPSIAPQAAEGELRDSPWFSLATALYPSRGRRRCH